MRVVPFVIHCSIPLLNPRTCNITALAKVTTLQIMPDILLGFPHLKYEKMYNDGYVNTVSNNQDLTPQSCPRAAKSSLNLCCGLGNISISSMAVSVSRICV